MARKAVFFDRDDTLINAHGDIQRPDQVKLLPGVPEALIQLKKMGYLLIVITNQCGVARGLLTEDDLEEIHHKLKKLLAAEGAAIDDLYYCPYHPEGVVKDFSIESNLRKPNAGMLFEAEKEHDIDLNVSWMIGDSYRDIAAGKAAGCQTILVDVPGKLREKKQDDPEPGRKAVNLREAVNIIRMYEFHQKAQQSKKTSDKNLDLKHETITEKQIIVPSSVQEPIQPKIESDQVVTSDSYVTENMLPVQISSAEKPEPNEKGIDGHDQSNHHQSDKSTKIYTTRELQEQRPTTSLDSESKTHHLLEELLHRIQSKDREGLYREFSIFKLLSLMIQVFVVFCLILSLFFWLNPNVTNESVIIMIGYAIALQLIVIALQIMHYND